ncbi:MAG: hypothetical protein ACP5RN_07750 [Armatimonadota bacterium]
MLQQRGGTVYIPAQRTLEGQLVVSRSSDLTYIRHMQNQATLSGQVGKYEYWFGKGFVVVVSNEQKLSDMPAPALVVPTPVDALCMGAFLPPVSDELAGLLHPSFIAGADPFRVFVPATWFRWRKGSWSLRERRGNLVVFHLEGVPGITAEFHLDASKRFAPVFFLAKTGTLQLEYSVQGWQSIGEGWVIGNRVQIREQGGSSSRTVTLVLQHVSKTSVDPRIDLPRGTPVTDLRHIPLDAIASRGLLFVQGPTYHYVWMGYLPEKQMLPAVGAVSAQPFVMVGPAPRVTPSAGFPVWLVVIGASATVIGILWYWRLRRVEGKE